LVKPKITIGVCIRNSADTLQEAIDSIVNQYYPHELMEVIFVDDGSKDETVSIINSNLPKIDMAVKVFSHEWKGLGVSRNVVVKNAKSDYIIWIDGDMKFSNDFVTKLVNFMETHPAVGIAKGKQSLESGGNLLSTLETCSRAVGRMVNYQSDKAGMKALGTGGSIYRMNAIQKTGFFDKNLQGYGEDWDLELRVRAAGWLLSVVDVEFSDYERNKLTWKNLWKKYWLRGYYTHYFLHKNTGLLKHCKMFPLTAFLTGFLHARKLFALTKRKHVFLLPFQYLFKMSAWYAGFIKSHLQSYAPK
jgi:glycosyltransferase involved in cell wall biosynthesis